MGYNRWILQRRASFGGNGSVVAGFGSTRRGGLRSCPQVDPPLTLLILLFFIFLPTNSAISHDLSLEPINAIRTEYRWANYDFFAKDMNYSHRILSFGATTFMNEIQLTREYNNQPSRVTTINTRGWLLCARQCLIDRVVAVEHLEFQTSKPWSTHQYQKIHNMTSNSFFAFMHNT